MVLVVVVICLKTVLIESSLTKFVCPEAPGTRHKPGHQGPGTKRQVSDTNKYVPSRQRTIGRRQATGNSKDHGTRHHAQVPGTHQAIGAKQQPAARPKHRTPGSTLSRSFSLGPSCDVVGKLVHESLCLENGFARKI